VKTSQINCVPSAKRTRMFDLVTETWNPITGCNHECVYCWARRLALAVASCNTAIFNL